MKLFKSALAALVILAAAIPAVAQNRAIMENTRSRGDVLFISTPTAQLLVGATYYPVGLPSTATVSMYVAKTLISDGIYVVHSATFTELYGDASHMTGTSESPFFPNPKTFGSSVTASAYFGDASHLTGLTTPGSHVITVAAAGAQFTTVGAAVASLGTPTTQTTILIQPGTYAETPFILPAFTDLIGNGGQAELDFASGAFPAIRISTEQSFHTIKNVLVAATSFSQPAIKMDGDDSAVTPYTRNGLTLDNSVVLGSPSIQMTGTRGILIERSALVALFNSCLVTYSTAQVHVSESLLENFATNNDVVFLGGANSSHLFSDATVLPGGTGKSINSSVPVQVAINASQLVSGVGTNVSNVSASYTTQSLSASDTGISVNGSITSSGPITSYGSIIGTSSITASAFFGDGHSIVNLSTKEFTGGPVADPTTFYSSVTVNGANGLLVTNGHIETGGHRAYMETGLFGGCPGGYGCGNVHSDYFNGTQAVLTNNITQNNVSGSIINYGISWFDAGNFITDGMGSITKISSITASAAITSASSVTASAFFGDGHALTNLSTAAYTLPADVAKTDVLNVFTQPQLFDGQINVNNNIVSTGNVHAAEIVFATMNVLSSDGGLMALACGPGVYNPGNTACNFNLTPNGSTGHGAYNFVIGGNFVVTITTTVGLDFASNSDLAEYSFMADDAAGFQLWDQENGWPIVEIATNTPQDSMKISSTGAANFISSVTASAFFGDVSHATGLPSPATTTFPVSAVTSQLIIHNLGYYPFVQVIDASGYQVIPDTLWQMGTSSFTVTFTPAFTGTIIYR